MVIVKRVQFTKYISKFHNIFFKNTTDFLIYHSIVHIVHLKLSMVGLIVFLVKWIIKELPEKYAIIEVIINVT